MATLSLDGNTIEVADTRMDLKGVAHMTETCDFLRGTITGLLRAYELTHLFAGNACRNEHHG
ncbi:MAG: hypothetical protein ACK2T2_06785, partial [Anaerolineales bacterium]